MLSGKPDHTWSLDKAVEIARHDPTGWHATIAGDRYLVGKADMNSGGNDRHYLADEHEELLCFASFAEAAQFLHTHLGVRRVVKL